MIPGVVVTADGGLAFDPEIAGERIVSMPMMLRVKGDPTPDELARIQQWWRHMHGVRF